MTTPRLPLRFGVLIAQHQRDWQFLLDGFKLADEIGLDSAWVFDHFIPLYGSEDGPCLDGWTLLGGLAAHTSHTRVGILVTGNTYRNPVLLAKQAVTVDTISGGRLNFGVGAGWFEREHDAYGFTFPPLKERVERFAEAMAVIDRLMKNQRSNFDGIYYKLHDAPFAPKPAQHIPIVIGASGPKMLRIVAQYADIWDTLGGDVSPEHFTALSAQVERNCREIGRDPISIRWQLSAGGHNIENVDTFRRFVADFSAVGVSDFVFDLPERKYWDTVRRIASEVIAELRNG